MVAGDDPNPFLPSYQGSVTTLTGLEAGAAGNGALNVAPSRDGIVRRVPLLLRLGERIYPALTAEALRTALGDANYVVKSSGASGVSRLAEKTGIRSVRIGGLAMTTDPHGGIWLHYSPPVDERVIPAWRVLAGQAPRDALAGAIVFVGTSAAGLMDLRLNPLGNIVAGAEMHAQVVEQMLQGTYLRRPDWAKAAEILFMVLMWALLVGSVLRFGAAWAAILGAVALAASYGGSWLAFTEARLLLDPTVPSLTALAVYLVCSLSRQLRTERDKRWIRKAFSSYISPNLVKYLIDNPDELDLGGHRRLCSFVMSDLAGFTSLVEKTDPAVVVALLNEYLDGMVAIALRHEGTLDRIVGDAVAVMFSAPVVQPDHAARAVACALEMDDFAQGFSERKRAEGVAVGHTRIGVNTGLVTIGNVGGQSLVDYRALGDAVNTSARLETVNRHLGTRICVSGSTAAACPGFTGRPVGTLVLVGKAKGIKAFEPLTPQRAVSTAVVRYLEAFELLAQGDDGAEAAFAALVQEQPDDPLAALHLDRLRAGETGVTIVMSKK